MASHDLFLRLIITIGLVLSLVPLFFVFFFQSCTTLAVADQYVNDQSFLQLPRGLNLSILASHNASSTSSSPLSLDLMFKVAMASLLDDYQGFFFPILSSPSFNLISYSRGFSLGFYFNPVDEESQKYIVYLAVCAVFSGNYTDPPTIWYYYLNSSFNHGHLYPIQSSDSFVFPVWIANLDKPIKDWEKASLGVVAAADSSADSSDSTTINKLQLKEGDEIVWNVSNVGMMEMRDSGDLVICSHINSTAPCSTNNVAWESFDMAGTDSRSDTLVQGQKLTVGGELKSNDSKYLARMEKGGLVLYLNNGVHFDGTINYMQQGVQPPPAPYRIFPILFHPSAPANATINQLISTAPCNNTPAFTVLDQLLDHPLAYNTTKLNLDPGACNNLLKTTIFSSSQNSDSAISWSFLRLENDGRLYVYIINNYAHAAPSFTKFNAPDSNSSPILIWPWPVPEYCDVPMACGPVGVCTPGAQTPCSCPPSIYFKARNNTDLSQGCERQTSLPACTTDAAAASEHINSTDFLELSSTASIFLFNGWSFKPTHAPVSHCKSLCSAACSCNGFFHQADRNINISACFFITGEFTLLTVVDENLSSLSYNASADELMPQQRAVIARNYATYLKVVSDLPISGSDKRSSATADNKPAANSLIVILPTIVAAVLVIGLVCVAAYRLLRARKRKSAQIRRQAEDEKELQDILPLLPSRFSYKDLHEATKGFSNLLGAGGCGSVYSGILWDGRKVAVKVLQVVLKGADQSRQFLAEVGTIGRTSHHNIVRLYGFCWELSHRLLVYEYVERGSLDHWLFNVDDRPEAFLDWRTRYNVALGIGRGMHYLHEECEPPILHFDIKPQNILLAEDFVAKLADFGMSRLIPRDASSVVTGVRGTPGYIAPEWLSHGKVSKKSDIFSMGMVLLELVGGRKIWDFSLLNSSLDPVEQEAWHLPRWGASMCEQGLMTELVDKRLHVCGFDQEEPQRLIHIAFWCIHDDPAMRPSALMVVQWLAEGTPPRKCPLFSTVINAALYYNKPLATNSVYIDESQ